MFYKLDDLIKKLILGIGTLSLLYLLLLSAFGTSSMGLRNFSGSSETENWGSYCYYLPDNFLKQMLATVLAVILISAIKKAVSSYKKEIPKWFVPGVCCLYFVVGACLILSTQMHPISDSAKVLRIAENMVQGQFDEFRVNEGYLWRYPDQLGIVWLCYVVTLLCGEFNFIILQFINLLAVIAIGVTAKKICDFLWKNGTGTAVLVLYFLFVPLLFYISYIYGTILGVCFSLAAIYQELRFLKSRKLRPAVAAALLIGIAIIMKTNSMIMLVAMLLFLAYDFVMEKGKGKVLIVIVMLLVFPAIFTQGLHAFMSYKSGFEVSEGMPKTAWVAMALGEGQAAPGTWNGQSVTIYENAGYDYDLANQMALESIGRSLERFADDRSEALRWLGRKIAFQWNNPTFGMAGIVQERPGEVELSQLLYSALYGKILHVLTGCLNYLQTFILFGCLIYFVFNRSKQGREKFIFLVVFLGGFVFHMAWEAKPEYVLPYFLMLFPYCVNGYRSAADLVIALTQKKVHIPKKKAIGIAAGILGAITLFVALYPTRLVQYTVAVQDEAELYIPYLQSVQESIWNK